MKATINDCESLLEWARRTIASAYNLPTLREAIADVDEATETYHEQGHVEVNV